jgi:rubrerythrin
MHLGKERQRFYALTSQYTRMSQQQQPSQNANLTTGLENITYNLISALDQEAKFLYKTIDTYIEDARRERRTDIEEVWKTIKEEKKEHVKMLREALSKDAKEEKLDR